MSRRQRHRPDPWGIPNPSEQEELHAYLDVMEARRRSYLRRKGGLSTQIIAYGDLMMAAQTLARIYHLSADNPACRSEVDALMDTGFRRLFELALGELQGAAHG